MDKKTQHRRKMPDLIDYATFSDNLAKFETKTFKLDIYYPKGDSRTWTALLNAGTDNVLVTYHLNKNYYGSHSFDVIASDSNFVDVDPEYIYDTLDGVLTHQSYKFAQ
jgi:hypothetical protein